MGSGGHYTPVIFVSEVDPSLIGMKGSGGHSILLIFVSEVDPSLIGMKGSGGHSILVIYLSQKISHIRMEEVRRVKVHCLVVRSWSSLIRREEGII